MITVIFGAGASYDSIPYKPAGDGANYPNRPPLANQLFDFRFGDAVNNFRACRPLTFRLRQLGSVPLEEELDRLMQEAGLHGGKGADRGDERLRRQLAAVRFYLQEVVATVTYKWPRDFAGITNYSILADRLEKFSAANDEPVLWVNFNYDTLLEEGLADVIHFRPVKVEDYVRHERHKVIKLHGSVNWMHPIIDPDSHVLYGGSGNWLAEQMIDRIDHISIADDIRVTIPGNFADDGRGLFPALTIPVRQKAAFECPRAHVDIMRAGLKLTNLLLVVGWAGNEENFLRLCRENLPHGEYRIHIVSGDEQGASSTARGLEASLVKGKVTSSQNGFTGFVSGSDLDKILEAPG